MTTPEGMQLFTKKEWKHWFENFKSLEMLVEGMGDESKIKEDIKSLMKEVHEFAGRSCSRRIVKLRDGDRMKIFDSNAEYRFFKWLNAKLAEAKYDGIRVLAQVPWMCIFDFTGQRHLAQELEDKFNKDIGRRRCDFVLLDCSGDDPKVRLVLELNGPRHYRVEISEALQASNKQDLAKERNEQYRRDLIEEYFFTYCLGLPYMTVQQWQWDKNEDEEWLWITHAAGLKTAEEIAEEEEDKAADEIMAEEWEKEGH